MSLKDKASKINFSVAAAKQEPDQDTPIKTKTAPGSMMAFANDRRSELLTENENLKKRIEGVSIVEQRLAEVQDELRQWDGVKGARLINTNEIRRSKYANRHLMSFDDAEFAVFKVEIENAGGNIQPIKVRPVKLSEGSLIKYEIVFGHRRHEACRQAGVPVLALIDNLDDQSLFVEMDRENRARKNLSAWEQGMMYKNALDSGLFTSARKMCVALGVDLSQVGKALVLAELPREIIHAFVNPLEIQFRWAKPLRDAIDARHDAVLRAASQLRMVKSKAPAAEIFNTLINAGTVGGGTVPPIKETVLFVGSNVSVEKKGLNISVKFKTDLNERDEEKLVNFIKTLVQ